MRGRFRLEASTLRERRRRVPAKTALGIALRLTVTDEKDARGIHKKVLRACLRNQLSR